ncbi:ABC1 family-domain-containing protein, partial [Paraphysoderma sedebokerense]
PVYAHYRVTEWLIKDKDDETQTKEFQELHTKYAPRMLDLALSLRGLYIKLGQVGTTRADVLPKTYRDCFQTLLDKVPSMEGSEVRAIVEKSLGKKIEDVFEYFDDEALGAASIGQAHVARLKDGREVVVKVQYPDAKHLFETDFDTARDFCELAQPEHLPIFNEMKAQFMTEFDFEREAWALDVVGKNIMPYFPDVIIPRPIPELSTDLVVVMEKVEGKKLVDAVLEHYEKVAESMGMSTKQLQTLSETSHDQTKSAVANASKMKIVKGYIKSIYDQNMKWYLVWSWNHSPLGWVKGKYEYPKLLPKFNPAAIFETVIKVHGREILIDGVFNGDPHPGNILLNLTPKGHKIGLIDYGQVKVLTREQRLQIAKIIIALAKDDKEAVIQQLYSMGFQTEKMDPEVAYKNAVILFDRDDKVTTEGYNIQQYLEVLAKRDKVVRSPDFAFMAGRVSVLMRGLGTLLNPDRPVKIAKIWVPYAEQALK